MSQFQLPNPWDPGYAIPRYVRGEPQGRGVFTTRQLPRGSFGPMPRDRRIWDRTGYKLPGYVKAESIGRGTFTTKMLPRRTVGALALPEFARPKVPFVQDRPRAVGSGVAAHIASSKSRARHPARATLVGSSLHGCSLGDLAEQPTAPVASPPPPARSPLAPIAVVGGAMALLYLLR